VLRWVDGWMDGWMDGCRASKKERKGEKKAACFTAISLNDTEVGRYLFSGLVCLLPQTRQGREMMPASY
jgi:hypothetical protein